MMSAAIVCRLPLTSELELFSAEQLQQLKCIVSRLPLSTVFIVLVHDTHAIAANGVFLTPFV